MANMLFTPNLLKTLGGGTTPGLIKKIEEFSQNKDDDELEKLKKENAMLSARGNPTDMKKGGKVKKMANMKKTKRFDDGGGVGKIVPRDLAEEDSSLNVNYDKLKGLKAVTGLDKKSSTRAGRELSDEDRQANTERIADMASKIPMVAAGSLAIPRMTQAGLTAAKLAEQYILPSPRGFSNSKTLMNESRNYKKGGKVSSASSRGDGIAQRGKTRGKMR
jgi:hypothetical protein